MFIMNSHALPSVLKGMRKTRSLSQTEFSGLIHKSNRELSFIETGRRPFSLVRASEYLNAVSRTTKPITGNEWVSIFKSFVLEIVEHLKSGLSLDTADQGIVADDEEEFVYEIPLQDGSCLKLSISKVSKEEYENSVSDRRRANLDFLESLPEYKLRSLLKQIDDR